MIIYAGGLQVSISSNLNVEHSTLAIYYMDSHTIYQLITVVAQSHLITLEYPPNMHTPIPFLTQESFRFHGAYAISSISLLPFLVT